MAVNTSLLDRAVQYAINAHQNTERRGTNVPYSVHIMEAVCIAATITDDQEILAAAALHDVVEDTNVTYEDLDRDFGIRVSQLVRSESDESFENREDSWYERKAAGIRRVKNSTRDEQIVAIADKLSNIRAIYKDYKTYGAKFFKKFHEANPVMHKWRWFELVKAFDKITETFAYEEFSLLVKKTFMDLGTVDQITYKDDVFYLSGTVTVKLFKTIEKKLRIDKLNKFDCRNILDIKYSLIHYLFNIAKKGYRIQYVNCSDRIYGILSQSGLGSVSSILKEPIEYSLENHELYGEGYTSLVYTTEDHDSIAKMYRPMVKMDSIEREKLANQGLLAMGFDTPLSGELIKSGELNGLIFEQISGKKSIARVIADEPEKLEYYVREFAKRCYDLHHTKCLKSYFGNVKTRFYHALKMSEFNDEEKVLVKNAIDAVPESDYCSHGDMHIGNMIHVDGKFMFIDLADFSYGNPLFDLGTFYFVTVMIDPDRFKGMFHFDKSLANKVWDTFISEYYKNESFEEVERQLELIKQYAGFTMLFFFSRGEWTKEKGDWILHTLKLK